LGNVGFGFRVYLLGAPAHEQLHVVDEATRSAPALLLAMWGMSGAGFDDGCSATVGVILRSQTWI